MHGALGLACLAPLAVTVITGALLALHEPLAHSPWSPERVTPVAAPARSARALLATAQDAQRGARARVFFPSHRADRAARVGFVGTPPTTVWLHPTTGRIVRAETLRPDRGWPLVYRLHRGKLFGPVGQALGSVLGVLVAVLWLLGLAVRTARPVAATNGSAAGLSRHRRWGAWPGGVVAFTCLLGATLNYAEPLRRRFDPPPSAPVAPRSVPVADVDALVTAAARAYPASTLESIELPGPGPRVPLLAYFADGTRLYLAPTDARVLALAPAATHWVNALYPWHSGLVWGPFGPLALGSVAFALGLLLVSGRRLRLRFRAQR